MNDKPPGYAIGVVRDYRKTVEIERDSLLQLLADLQHFKTEHARLQQRNTQYHDDNQKLRARIAELEAGKG